ncbi:hypothetical protein OIU84_026519 [Salix udensis]|uniref:Reverse transcriptase zinc-binding domain-containing protein n=1 Tax=Salix udensis TaxID=889485 RepID=A0AAD6KM65_9ROSI|nr:hypothetical protein OIU84_026519 [Salix udensis]
MENHNHLFFSPPCSRQQFERELVAVAHLTWPSVPWVQAWGWVVERCSSTNVATQRLVGLVLAAAIYHIWQERNRRIHDHHFSSVERTREAIMFSIRTKLATLDVGDDLPASLLQAWDIQ